MPPSLASAEPVKVGIIAPFSGPFSNFGEDWKRAIEAYQKIHGKSAGGHEIELVFRDLTGPNPSEAKALAQELVIKEKVQYLGGVVFTPNAFAIAPVVEEAEDSYPGELSGGQQKRVASRGTPNE